MAVLLDQDWDAYDIGPLPSPWVTVEDGGSSLTGQIDDASLFGFAASWGWDKVVSITNLTGPPPPQYEYAFPFDITPTLIEIDFCPASQDVDDCPIVSMRDAANNQLFSLIPAREDGTSPTNAMYFNGVAIGIDSSGLAPVQRRYRLTISNIDYGAETYDWDITEIDNSLNTASATGASFRTPLTGPITVLNVFAQANDSTSITWIDRVYIEGTADTTVATPTISAEVLSTSAARLTGSAYSGDETHEASQWQVDVAAGDFSTPVLDSGTDTVNLLTYLASGLDKGTNYKARVRYQDRFGTFSSWSTPVAFRTTESNFIEDPAPGGGGGFDDDLPAGADGFTDDCGAGTVRFTECP